MVDKANKIKNCENFNKYYFTICAQMLLCMQAVVILKWFAVVQ